MFFFKKNFCQKKKVYIYSLQVRYLFSNGFRIILIIYQFFLRDFNISFIDLHDKLTDSNFGNWFIREWGILLSCISPN